MVVGVLPHVTSRVARLGGLRPNFWNLAVFQVGWPFGFFGRFLKVVWPKMFSVGRFWKYVHIRLTKLSTTTPFVCVSHCVVNYKWKRGSVSVRLCLPRCADLALCRPTGPAVVCVRIPVCGCYGYGFYKVVTDHHKVGMACDDPYGWYRV